MERTRYLDSSIEVGFPHEVDGMHAGSHGEKERERPCRTIAPHPCSFFVHASQQSVKWFRVQCKGLCFSILFGTPVQFSLVQRSLTARVRVRARVLCVHFF